MFVEEIKDISPVEAFRGLRRLPMPFIFSGGKAHGQRRYSFLGAAPFMTVSARPDGIIIEADGTRRSVKKDPFRALSEIIAELQGNGHSGKGPFPFNSGAAGYFSYGLKDVIEPGMFKKADNSDGIPLLVVGFYDPLFVYDHHENKGYIVSRVSTMERRTLFMDAVTGMKKPGSAFEPTVQVCGPLSSTHTKGEYMDTIARAQEYIAAGDIYQINLSQRLTLPLKEDAFSLYLSLIDASPAPFSSFMDLGGFQIISNSPERLLKVSGGYAETSPIKGTRPRGETPKKDMLLIEELKKSSKERAEHVMIVDLVRNDLGRISLPGSVEVTDFETIETFRNLHHMVSNVRGRLKAGVDPVSALKALFPGGSVTGAPKIRAMEIIDELEPVKRSVYTGGIGWIDLDNEMDMAMAIRTALLMDGHLYLNVGGGIVADSVPEDEYDETILKAQSFLEVMGIALNGTNY